MKKHARPKFFLHLKGLKIKAVFSDCGNFRYLLEIAKETEIPGKRVCAIMLNPSVANEVQADKSVQFLEKLIFEKNAPYFKNVTGLTIVNLFAFIQTRKFEGTPKQLGPLNDQYIAAAISEADIILIAWGKTCSHPKRQAVVFELLAGCPDKQILATSSHPSRGRYANFVSPWNA